MTMGEYITTPPLEENEIVISSAAGEFLRFKGNGDIYVRGKLVENDKEVVQGIRDFLKLPEPKSLNGGRSRFERINDT